ncbi:unnamed protein product [Discosporangium mesarthrocarpum]
MYYQATGGGKLSILITYVEDVLLTGNDHGKLIRIKRQLLRKTLGVKISITEQGISLNQELYAESIVTEGMGSIRVRGASTPLDPGMDMAARREDEEILNGKLYPYPTLVGKLVFLAGMTRPDLFISIPELGRRTNARCLSHWRGLQHVLRYIATHPEIGIGNDRRNGEKSNKMITGYSDSDWG